MYNKHIVIINGPSEHGKDTFIDFVGEKVKVVNISSVDKVKEAAMILGLTSKELKDREFLSDLKKLADKYYDHSYKYIDYNINAFRKVIREDAILFIHIREIENIKRMIAEGWCTTLLLTDPRKDIIELDRAVFNSIYDIRIVNDGTKEQLKEKAFKWLDKLGYKI